MALLPTANRWKLHSPTIRSKYVLDGLGMVESGAKTYFNKFCRTKSFGIVGVQCELRSARPAGLRFSRNAPSSCRAPNSECYGVRCWGSTRLTPESHGHDETNKGTHLQEAHIPSLCPDLPCPAILTRASLCQRLLWLSALHKMPHIMWACWLYAARRC